MSDPETWAVDLKRIADKLPEEQMRTVVRAVALRALEMVVDASPVGNPDLWASPAPPGYVGGQFRGAWFVAVGGAGSETSTAVDADGGRTKARGASVISGAPAYTKITLYNNLPYAWALEHGHSTQAPQGVVGLTLAALQTWADRA